MHTHALANRFATQAITSAFCSYLSRLVVWGVVCTNIKQNANVAYITRCMHFIT